MQIKCQINTFVKYRTKAFLFGCSPKLYKPSKWCYCQRRLASAVTVDATSVYQLASEVTVGGTSVYQLASEVTVSGTSVYQLASEVTVDDTTVYQLASEVTADGTLSVSTGVRSDG
jgi:hypothetical protein